MHLKNKIRLAVLAAVLLLGRAAAGDGKLGLGIILGHPTGISGKYWLSQTTAVDAALAYSLMGRGHIYLHADHLWHFSEIIDIEQNILAYIGIGPSVKVGDHDGLLRARVPLGIELLLGGTGDIFVELVPVLELIPATDVDFDAGIGARFFF
ncbi:hypothetical protein ACFL5V_09500 [Fibrobacterota bacterium]